MICQCLQHLKAVNAAPHKLIPAVSCQKSDDRTFESEIMHYYCNFTVYNIIALFSYFTVKYNNLLFYHFLFNI